MAEQADDDDMKLPDSRKVAKLSRGALQVIGGAVPFAGGVLSAIAGTWSEGEQEKVNRFFEHWVRMLQDEIKEKEETIIEIMARLDLQDDAIAKRCLGVRLDRQESCVAGVPSSSMWSWYCRRSIRLVYQA